MNCQDGCGRPLARADDIRFDYPDPADAGRDPLVKYIHYPQLRDGGTIPDVFTLYVELKRRDGQEQRKR